MKFILSFSFLLLSTAINSCVTTKIAEKEAYINNESVKMPNEKATDITIVCVTMKEDRSVYEKIAGDIQSYLMKKNIPSDMLFFDATEATATVNAKIHQSSKKYYLVVEKMNGSYQKDEMNNDFIVKQLQCSLQKSSGEYIANLTIGIDRNSSKNSLGKAIADLITGYLGKKGLI